jgi:hypothetical protein
MMTSTRQTPCHRAFATGQQSRAKSPLPSGAYKLRKAQRSIQHYFESFYAIRDYLLHPKKFHRGAPLGHCTTDDKATYLKGIPESIARLFGKDVLPSIKALGADGLSQREIATELQIATHKAQILLQDCELQHQRLRGGIKDEYEAIKSGYSDLFGLLQDTEQIIESPLQALESNKARAPLP